MIELKVNWFIYKEMVRCYLIGKITPHELDIDEIVYQGILRSFYIGEDYTIYLMDAPEGEISLHDLIHEEGLIKWNLTEQELTPYFDYIRTYLIRKFVGTNVKIIDVGMGEKRFLKVFNK